MDVKELEYVGFWARAGATLIDTILMGAIIWPLLTSYYGSDYWASNDFIQGPVDFLLSWLLPAVGVCIFWTLKQATPGKMVIGARVVDANTGLPLTYGQSIGRYLGYYVCTIPAMLGFIWVAFDPKKQGWHDKMTGTVVVRNRKPGSQLVRFDE